MEQAKIAGIAFNRDEAQLTVKGVPDQPGIAAKILGPISRANIEIDMIVQSTPSDDQTIDISFTVQRDAYKQALDQLQMIAKRLKARKVLSHDKVAKLSIVGIGMRNHAKVASVMFHTLEKEGIAIQLISTSEIKVSVLIDEKYIELGARLLHDVFDLAEPA